MDLLMIINFFVSMENSVICGLIQAAILILKEDGFPHARIDWYNIGGKIIFGEITFYSWSGYSVFDPDSFDFEMGKYFNINYK